MGSRAICVHLLTIPPGGRAKSHKHATHETAIYIPADTPHLPMNAGLVPCHAVISRTDPREQESVILLPAMEHLVA